MPDHLMAHTAAAVVVVGITAVVEAAEEFQQTPNTQFGLEMAVMAVKESSSSETTEPLRHKGGMTWIIKRTRRRS